MLIVGAITGGRTVLRLLCSTGTFSRYPNWTDYRLVLHYAPQLDVDGLELMVYPGWYPELDRIAEALGQSGLEFPVVHADKDIGAALGSVHPDERQEGLHHLALNCHLAAKLGADLVVLHLWGLPDSDKHLQRNLDTFAEALSVAAEAGVTLSVETVPGFLAGPLDNVRRVIERYPRCLVTLDTEFLAFQGQLEAALQADWLWQDGRVCHVHAKDFDGHFVGSDKVRRYLHPGEGQIDFALFFAKLRERGFSGAISLESPAVDPEGSVHLSKLHRSLALLQQWLE
jgi:sugar phosphate isomerase/epimerase